MKNWGEIIQKSEKHEREYRERARKCIEVYRDDAHKKGLPKMNLLWSNTETLRPALYSQTPQPVVQRRFLEQDPVAKQAAEVLEKGIAFSIDNGLGEFDLFAQKVVTDTLLTGRSVDRVCYEPLSDNDDNLVFEEVRYEHVPWDQFRYDNAERWEDVRWVAYGDHWYNWDELKKEYELSEADKAKYTATKKKSKDLDTEEYQVWEIWDRDSEEVIHQISGCEEPLKSGPPPVRLRGFFNCPEPLYSFRTNDSLVPIPEYTLYQYQAEEVNTLTQRISKIANVIRANFVFAGDQKVTLENLLTADDGTGIPVANWTALTERGGVDGLISYAPVEQYVKVLQILVAQRAQLVQQIFEITGISDILRGATDARETKGAQVLKANFGNRRLLPRQREVQRYFRDLFRLAGEVIVENFNRETLQDIVGQKIDDPVLTMLRSDADRAFRVDIETDSTIAPDEMQQKQDLAEFMQAISSFLPAAQAIAQQGGQQAMAAILLWAIRRFRAGRDVEDIIEGMMKNPAPPKPDPEMEKLKAEMQAKQQESQMKQQEQQAALALKAQEAQLKFQTMQQESQLKLEALMQEMKLEQAKFMQELQQSREMSNVKVMNTVAEGRAREQVARAGGRNGA